MSTSTDEEMFKSVESELKFLMDEASVPRDIQKLVYSKGFTSVRIFCGHRRIQRRSAKNVGIAVALGLRCQCRELQTDGPLAVHLGRCTLAAFHS